LSNESCLGVSSGDMSRVSGRCDDVPLSASDGFCPSLTQIANARRTCSESMQSPEIRQSYWAEGLLFVLGGVWVLCYDKDSRQAMHIQPPASISQLSTQPHKQALFHTIESPEARPNGARSMAERSIWHGPLADNAFGCALRLLLCSVHGIEAGAAPAAYWYYGLRASFWRFQISFPRVTTRRAGETSTRDTF
jgi:hypothetical protein